MPVRLPLGCGGNVDGRRVMRGDGRGPSVRLQLPTSPLWLLGWVAGAAQWHGFGLDEGPAPGPPGPVGRCSEGHKLDERRERAESSGSRPPVTLGKAESLRSGLGPAARVVDMGPRRGVELLAGRAEAAGPGPGAPWGSEGCEADSGREARLRRRAGSAGPARGAAGEQGAPP